ncbi:MAG: hypothetical protein GEU92_18510 [Alphaproteobacteria bacterium]|nr:hypothetical protein [Alphaproteobacteria bacterium]
MQSFHRISMTRPLIAALAAALALSFSMPVLADPPPWAPAHGYRAKHKGRDRGPQVVYQVPAVGIPQGTCNRKLLGSLLGGAAGAADSGRVVHLLGDFEVGPGPRYHVYLADRADIRTNDDFRAAAVTDLGRLRAFEGSQVYAIPDGFDLAPIKSVVIWCKAFGVLVSPATLKPAGG